ncbi:MAG: flagellar basal body rod protein FlgC [Candidatus Tectomicrobia bacterium]|uniref:Flagellar basal-body rod protein FlgC n=1 Tax=Tectimicrobiota bacterium TaxID=2528274 RepID=A0A932CQQ8_UNCTE|nr:flagellar basal body rod protein FlgC [Candidatus Tectomicrobia bacterium]
MALLPALRVGASGLTAQRLRMNVISTNLANVNTTRTAEGGPYRRQDPVFAALPAASTFEDSLRAAILPSPLKEVRVVGIAEDTRGPRMVYDPQHPDANPQGYVAMPNIDTVTEMIDLLSAARAYEANVTAINATKSMAMKALEIGRS